jgi:hypothetical protein
MLVNPISGCPPPPSCPIVRYLYTNLEEIGVGGWGDDFKRESFWAKKGFRHKNYYTLLHTTGALIVKNIGRQYL